MEWKEILTYVLHVPGTVEDALQCDLLSYLHVLQDRWLTSFICNHTICYEHPLSIFIIFHFIKSAFQWHDNSRKLATLASLPTMLHTGDLSQAH